MAPLDMIGGSVNPAAPPPEEDDTPGTPRDTSSRALGLGSHRWLVAAEEAVDIAGLVVLRRALLSLYVSRGVDGEFGE